MNALGDDSDGEINMNVPSADESVSSSFGRIERETVREGSTAKASVSGRPSPKGQAAKKTRKVWKKPEGMPKRPLSAYNLFFRAEREQILGKELSREYEITDQSRRKHRKTHGKVGFAEMARLISDRWKSISPEKKQAFENEALQEKNRYNKELLEWQKTELEAASEAETGAEDIVRKVSSEESPLSARDHSQGATYEVSQAALSASDLAVRHLTHDPRSETASLHMSLLAGTRTAATSSRGANSGAASLAGKSVVRLSHRQDSVTMTPIAQAFPQSSGLLTASVPATHGSSTSFRGIASSPPTGSNLMLPGSHDRVRRLEELYRLHLTEAASLREELGREVTSSSGTGTTASAFLQQPKDLQMTAGRQYADFHGFAEAASVREDLLRQGTVPPAASSSASAFPHNPQWLNRTVGRRFSDFPAVSQQQMDMLGGSERRFTDVPRPALLPPQQLLRQGRTERLLAPPPPLYGSASMPADFREERLAPPPPLYGSASMPADYGRELYAIEQARQDLIALETAAEIRKANLAALDQRMAAASWGMQPLQHSGSSAQQRFLQPHQHGHLPPSQPATAADRFALEQTRRLPEDEWFEQHHHHQQQQQRQKQPPR